MKQEKLLQYLLSKKKKINEDPDKYDQHLLNFLSSDQVTWYTFSLDKHIVFLFYSTVFQLDPGTYRRILLNAPTRIIPRMANPLLIADFLTNSYETQNNTLKILALHGLYILMTQCNLEYPFFFGKVYALLTVDLLSAKYKARLFYLLDIFLQSS